MDCNQAQLAMMEHMEKTIHPARARDLTKHVLVCESCREYYIGFDMALEVLDDAELSTPPVDFTQRVMLEVCKLPAHSKPIALYLRILWGLGAIFLGIGLLFAFNPDWLTALADSSPIVASIINAMYTAREFVSGWLAEIPMPNQGTGLSALNIAIVFVVTIGALLLILHRSEKREKRAKS